MSSKQNISKEKKTMDEKAKESYKKKLSSTGVSDIINVNRWWEKDESDNEDSDKKWKTLEHNGVIFPAKYEPHNVKILYKNTPITLNPEQEEIATFWAGIMENDLSLKETTQKNFLKEFKQVMGKEYENSKFSDFDFSPILTHIQKVREKNRNKTPEEKKAEKEKKQKIYDYYGFALVDGISEKISNYLVEPPGIFRGRGEHPLAGRLKKRIYPENCTLNLGEDNPVPKCSLDGHAWNDIVFNDEATWLAYYKENTEKGNTKYVFLASKSKFKGLNDKKKYEKARKLKDKINSIREDYNKQLTSDNEEKRQLGVATYLIDKLALRVGNEKNEDEADTVGCCSLRVEHIIFEENCKITLDFLGKDSMRYHNTVIVDQKIYDNLKRFVKGKKPENDLFDLINVKYFMILFIFNYCLGFKDE